MSLRRGAVAGNEGEQRRDWAGKQRDQEGERTGAVTLILTAGAAVTPQPVSCGPSG